METYCVKEKKKLHASNPVGIKQQKMGEKCFGVLALPAESKKHDLLRETKRAPTSWGRSCNSWKICGKSWKESCRNGPIFCK